MPTSNIVRTQLDDAWLKVFESIRLDEKLTRQQFMLILCKGGLRSSYGVIESPTGVPVRTGVGCLERNNEVTDLSSTEAVDLVRIRITTRQKASFKKLLVPGCKLEFDNSSKEKKIYLLYPLSREAEVLAWKASCPTGGRKKSGVAKSDSNRGPYNTKRVKVVNGAVAVLREEQRPIFIRELYDLLKERGCTPTEVSARDDVTRYIKESSLFEFDRINELVSLKENSSSPTIEDSLFEEDLFEKIARDMEENPPMIEEESAPVQDPPAATEDKTQSVSPKVPSFFPKNWFPTG
jgi:hypothetical protein